MANDGWLLDQFAAKAMAALIGNSNYVSMIRGFYCSEKGHNPDLQISDKGYKAMASEAYRIAAAMIEERREVNHMDKNHEGAAEGQTEKPADQGATEGAGQTEDKGEQKPAPDGD